VELPRACEFATVRHAARAQGVVFAAGDVFFPALPCTSYVRLNCARAAEPELVRGLEILGGILSALP